MCVQHKKNYGCESCTVVPLFKWPLLTEATLSNKATALCRLTTINVFTSPSRQSPPL